MGRMNSIQKLIPKKQAHLCNGPSSFSKRKYCSGSLELELKNPDTEAGEAASKGTIVHDCIEVCLPYAMKAWNKDWSWGDLPKKVQNKYSFDELDSAQRAVEDILNRVIPGLDPELITWAAERFYMIDEENHRGGTADFSAAYQSGNKVIGKIWDYKNGIVPVDARKSDQVKEYAIGLQIAAGWSLDIVHGYIFQPNSRAEYATEVMYTKEQLQEINEKHLLIARTALGLEGPTKLVAGDHCLFCSAKAVCPAYHSRVQEIAVTSFDDDLPELDDAAQAVERLTDEQKLRAYKFIPYLDKFKDSLKAHLVNRSLSGAPVPGVDTVHTKPKNLIDGKCSTAKLKKELKKHGVSKVVEEKPLARGKLISLLKQQGVEDPEAVMKPFTTQSKPGIKLVLTEEINMKTVEVAREESPADAFDDDWE